MKLTVGLLQHSAAWEQLLQQEGVSFREISLRESGDDYCVLIVNRRLGAHERRTVEEYLRSGGALLGSAEHLDGVSGTTSRRERIQYLVASGNDVFSNIQLIDVGVMGSIPREANCLRTQDNTFAAFAGELGGGPTIVLPVDIAALMFDSRAADKNFYSSCDRLPSERVSLVSKGEIRRLLHRSLEYLHHARNLPYIHLWYFPDQRRNLFAFRIDSDKGSRQEIDALYDVARKHDMRMSWFLDVKNHENWLHHFAFLTGQEIGVHCYEHRTHDTFDAYMKDISKARHKLQRVGLSTPGYAAPFGSWNRELAKTLDEIAFEYSSEFSYAYDSLPLFPVEGEQTYSTVQIPIHPICIGSMRRVGYSEKQMKQYFTELVDEKLLRDEPMFFYHHPTHRCWNVLHALFQYVKDRNIENVSFEEYARWWKKRSITRITLSLNSSMINIETGQKIDDSQSLRISDVVLGEAIVPIVNAIELHALSWSRPKLFALPSDIRRIREFDPRAAAGVLFTSFTRKLGERRTNS